jgi:hypothetical protein
VVCADIFLEIILLFLSARQSRACEFNLSVSCDDKNSPCYFNNKAPFRKLQDFV